MLCFQLGLTSCFLSMAVFYEMDTEVNASSAQGCDNAGPARGTVRSSPRLHALNTEKNKEKMKFKNRRKVLRISNDNDEDDSDYAPAPLTRVIM